jgi:hypothetical protein
MTPATCLARTILYLKSVPARQRISETSGKRAFGHPVSLEHRWKAAEAWRRFNAMSAEARREYYFEKKARWLTNCLVNEPGRRVFRLRCKGDDGQMVDLETWIAYGAHEVALLLKLMRMPHAPLVLRLDCAKVAAAYLHRRPKARVVVQYRERLSVIVAGGLPDAAVATDEPGRTVARKLPARRSSASLAP